MYLGMSEEQKTTYRNILESRGDYSHVASTSASTTAPLETGLVKKNELVKAFEQEFKAFLDVENEDVEMEDEEVKLARGDSTVRRKRLEELIFEIHPD